MPTQFPTMYDNFRNPLSTDFFDQADAYLDVMIGNLNDAVEAIEFKLGINNSITPTTIDYRLRALEQAGGGGPGATNLDALTDVAISSPGTNQVLGYNGTTWVNMPSPAAGGTAGLSWTRVSGTSLTALHTARDTAPEGGTVYVPAGTYATDGTLLLNKKNQRWIFDANSVLTRITSGAGGRMLDINAEGVVVEGGVFDGKSGNTFVSGSAFSSEWTGMIYITGDRSGIQNAEIRYALGYGVMIQGCDYGFVKNCYAHHNAKMDLYSEGSSSTTTRYPLFQDCIVHSYGVEAGIHHRGNTGTTMTEPNWGPRILGCICKRFENHLGAGSADNEICIEVWGHTYHAIVSACIAIGGWMGVSIDRSRFATVVGNSTIDVKNGYELAGTQQSIVTGNTYDGGLRSNSVGVSCSNFPNDHNVVTGNYFYNFSVAGVHCNGSTGDTSPYYVISGNQFHISATGADGVRLQHAMYIAITGNGFYGAVRGDGIKIDSHSETGPNMTSISVTGNVFAHLDRCFEFIASGTVGATTPSLDRMALVGNVFTDCTTVLGTPSSRKIGNVYLGDAIKTIGNIGLSDYKNFATGTLY